MSDSDEGYYFITKWEYARKTITFIGLQECENFVADGLDIVMKNQTVPIYAKSNRFEVDI